LKDTSDRDRPLFLSSALFRSQSRGVAKSAQCHP
jgi:hypothetical protein